MAQPDAEIHGLEHPDGKPVRGTEAFKEFHRQFPLPCPTSTSRLSIRSPRAI
jgi:hypothetical protein